MKKKLAYNIYHNVTDSQITEVTKELKAIKPKIEVIAKKYKFSPHESIKSDEGVGIGFERKEENLIYSGFGVSLNDDSKITFDINIIKTKDTNDKRLYTSLIFYENVSLDFLKSNLEFWVTQVINKINLISDSNFENEIIFTRLK